MISSGDTNLLPAAADAAAAVVLVLATCVWVGGFVTLVVVSRVARKTLSGPGRISFFRGLGRSYGTVSTIGLCFALASGIALVAGISWSALLIASVVVAACLVLTTAGGVKQARRMTRLRRSALEHPDDPDLKSAVSRGARRAAVVRGMIGALTITLTVLGCLLAV